MQMHRMAAALRPYQAKRVDRWASSQDFAHRAASERANQRTAGGVSTLDIYEARSARSSTLALVMAQTAPTAMGGTDTRLPDSE